MPYEMRAKADIELIPCFFCPKQFLSYRCWHLHDIYAHKDILHQINAKKSAFKKGREAKMQKRKHESSTSKNKALKKRQRGNIEKKVVNFLPDIEGQQETLDTVHTKSKINLHKKENVDKCRFCSKTFSSKINKKRHERYHECKKSHKCQFCEKMFVFNSAKLNHERKHTGEKPFKCEFCAKTFSQKSAQNRHAKTHTGEKPFKCEFCPKRFFEKSDQNRHVRTHTGEKPFKCNFCPETYSRKFLQKSHERTHTGEKKMKE